MVQNNYKGQNITSRRKSGPWLGLYVLSKAGHSSFIWGANVQNSGEGTCLAMLKTIRVPNTSSLNTSSGATEGVLD